MQSSKNCDQCPLVVPCLARGGLEIRVCSLCRRAFYGEKTGDDFFSRVASGAIRPLRWDKRAHPIVGDVLDVPCACDQLADYQSKLAKYKFQWRCGPCVYRKFSGIHPRVDFSEPHIVSEPADKFAERRPND
jgi:hypothetical protein